jgi:uncharacterized membrane protein YbhN (UPF0104 family)
MQIYRYLRRSLDNPLVIRALNGATLLFGLVLLAVIGWRNREVLQQSWQFDWRMIGVSLAVYSVNLLVVVVGWAQLVNQLCDQQIPYRDHLRVYAATNLSKRLPGSFWYIAGRAVQYNRLTISAGITSLASILEYILFGLSSIVVSLALFPFTLSSSRFSLPILLVSMAAGLILIQPSIIRRILRWIGKPTDIPLNNRHLLRSLFWYVLGWLLGGVMCFGIIRIIYVLPLASLPTVVGAWSLSGAVALITFFSPSGLGFKEISLAALLSMEMPSAVAIAVAILARFVVVLFEFLWTFAGFGLEKGPKEPSSPSSG